MLAVADLMVHPFPSRLSALAGVELARPIEHVLIADSLDDLDEGQRGAIVLITPTLSATLQGYRLDVAVRLAGEREAAALVLHGTREVPATARRIAMRGRTALLAAPPEQSLSRLALGIGRLLHPDPAEMLARVLEALDAIALAEPSGTAAVLAGAEGALGSALTLGPTPAGQAATILVEGRRDGFVGASGEGADARLVAHLAAGAIGRVREAERRRVRNRRQGRADVLGDLLLAPERRLPRLAERARDLGVVLDGVVTVAQFELEPSPGPATDRDRLAEAAADDDLDEIVLDALAHRPGAWHRARIDRALLIVHTDRIGGAGAVGGERDPLHDALGVIADARPGLRIFCGVGESGTGVEGLRRSATEAAAAAAAARNTGRAGTPVRISTIGLPRVLIEWLASRGGQEAVSRLLTGLDALGPERAQTAIDTLSVYLDERGSLKASAERLHLHRNAVAYRMRAIREQLGVDLDDPDQRLALQLACRARALQRDP